MLIKWIYIINWNKIYPYYLLKISLFFMCSDNKYESFYYSLFPYSLLVIKRLGTDWFIVYKKILSEYCLFD